MDNTTPCGGPHRMWRRIVRGEIFYWVRNPGEEFKAKGIVVVFAWVSVSDVQLKDFIGLYSFLGWNSLVCRSDYLNPGFVVDGFRLDVSIHSRESYTLAFSVLNELVKELRRGPSPVVFAAFSGGCKACMYKVLQIIEGCAEVELSLEDSRLVASCISGQIYDSDPVQFTTDLGARFALHPSILKVPGSAKLVSLFAKGVTSSLDALFITRFGSQLADYWRTLYSSVGLRAPFLILCSEHDDVAPISTLCNFAQRIQELGGNVKFVKWSTTAHLVSIFSEKIQKLAKKSHMDDMHDEISELICDLQNAAVDSNQSFRRVAVGPNDHFFLPSSSEYQDRKEFGSVPEDSKERSPHHPSPCMSANSVLGQILFDVCVPKNVEGWDIKFSGSLNGEPFASRKRRKSFMIMKEFMEIKETHTRKRDSHDTAGEPRRPGRPVRNNLHFQVEITSSVMERAEEIQANLAAQFPSFVKPMIRSNVTGGFWLSLPKLFCKLHLPSCDIKITLVDESNKEYYTKYLPERRDLVLDGGDFQFHII
ncbi:B3 domain-containing protein [Sesamum angolense]|uniref:B3 domain-containing protein n=1 Tax=Sesamum angolense TaxID=2727404 RepID=A0AAE1WYK1_9LAMI|nr:B3 domain-containing protein [Sesamum angolense]